MKVRGIRGAITVEQDMAAQVIQATQELLQDMQRENDLILEDIASALFTVTADIRSVFPAQAARTLGWDQVPLMCFQEIEVTGALPLCIRVLLLVNTEKNQAQIKHIYLREARKLRQDLKTKE